MTKVMTALVACEQITDWDATFTMTQAIIDPLFLSDATMAGFVNGEEVSMTDLVYGALLPSGAEATEALAQTIAGSTEGFVALMNEKAAELGLTNTNFVNSAGISVRKVVRAALDANATSVVLAHNHPSGVALPSEEDKRVTQVIRDALDAVDILLADHIIVADGDFVSLADDGILG